MTSSENSKTRAIVEILPRPGVKTLPHPICHLKSYEFEDLLDKAALLEAFNKAYAGQPGFEFLPLKPEDLLRTNASVWKRQSIFWLDCHSGIAYRRKDNF